MITFAKFLDPVVLDFVFKNNSSYNATAFLYG